MIFAIACILQLLLPDFYTYNCAKQKASCDHLSCDTDSHTSTIGFEKSLAIHGLSLPFKLGLRKYACIELSYFYMESTTCKISILPNFLQESQYLPIRYMSTLPSCFSKSCACPKCKYHQIYCTSLGDCNVCMSLALSARLTVHGQYTTHASSTDVWQLTIGLLFWF